jgi:hypothetical protein
MSDRNLFDAVARKIVALRSPAQCLRPHDRLQAGVLLRTARLGRHPERRYTDLPAYYLSTEKTSDQADYLRSPNIDARVAAIIAEASYDAEKVEAHRSRKNG